MATFIERQLTLLGSQDPVEVLRATPARLAALVERLGTAGMRRSREAGKWSGAQVLAHLADMEIVFAYRIRQAIAETGHVFQLVDQDRWAHRYAEVDVASGLAALAGLRGWNLSLLATLDAAQRERQYVHPERGGETLDKLLRIWAGHDLNHCAQIEALL